MATPSCDRMMPSRDVCTPRALSDQDEQEGGCPGIFPPRRMHLAAMTAAQSGHSANYLCRLRADSVAKVENLNDPKNLAKIDF